MKFIKIFYINILLLGVLSSTAVSQDISQITFINELDGKSAATYGDALRMFEFQERNSNLYMLKGYNNDARLTKGMASLMTARYLKLNKSLMYKIFDIERYAYRACLADKFFSIDGGENDLMSGPELIELLAKINDYKSGK
ncbi:MAG: hypothetical protein FWF73_00010 [Spirochaetes bacterium]|nr:hypothetical protein [Spirochaetota bacterium]